VTPRIAAAIAAAAALLAAPTPPARPAADRNAWPLAARLPTLDADRARALARGRSRWAQSGRLDA
jgi:hypothetical protein